MRAHLRRKQKRNKSYPTHEESAVPEHDMPCPRTSTDQLWSEMCILYFRPLMNSVTCAAHSSISFAVLGIFVQLTVGFLYRAPMPAHMVFQFGKSQDDKIGFTIMMVQCALHAITNRSFMVPDSFGLSTHRASTCCSTI